MYDIMPTTDKHSDFQPRRTGVSLLFNYESQCVRLRSHECLLRTTAVLFSKVGVHIHLMQVSNVCSVLTSSRHVSQAVYTYLVYSSSHCFRVYVRTLTLVYLYIHACLYFCVCFFCRVFFVVDVSALHVHREHRKEGEEKQGQRLQGLQREEAREEGGLLGGWSCDLLWLSLALGTFGREHFLLARLGKIIDFPLGLSIINNRSIFRSIFQDKIQIHSRSCELFFARLYIDVFPILRTNFARFIGWDRTRIFLMIY